MYDSRCIGTILHAAAPQATAQILGSEKYDSLRGVVSFYDIGYAILVTSSFYGIPDQPGNCRHLVLGFHIHEGTSCTGTGDDPIFVNDGTAWGAFVTTRFTIREILGRAVIVHAMPDDFHTQPSGDSGEKIACGIIRRT